MNSPTRRSSDTPSGLGKEMLSFFRKLKFGTPDIGGIGDGSSNY